MPDFVPTHRLTEEASLKMLAAGATMQVVGALIIRKLVDIRY